jgi:Protein of unknown function (DUF2637)
MRTTNPQLREYRIVRRFVAGIVIVGVAVSVAVNQLDAHTLISKAIFGWPPIGLLLTLELLTRIPNSKRFGAFVRVLATISVSGAAAWLSYWHMVAAAAANGESVLNAHIWPATVDGLMGVAAVGMVELGARIRGLRSQGQRVADAAANATELVRAVDAIEPVATVERVPSDPVEAMRSEPYWGARLGKRTANK